MLSDGELGPISLSEVYAPDACYQGCLAELDCERLSAALCRTNLELLIACDQRCAHRCGDGSLIGVERRCDGLAQCSDGSDEASCPGYEILHCGDGIDRGGRRCDGIYTCPDGRDERDCPAETYTCDGGRTYGAWDRCNGYPTCADRSDEADCPAYVCADHMRITHREGASPRCTGWTECEDGSDEAGCARLMLSCAR